MAHNSGATLERATNRVLNKEGGPWVYGGFGGIQGKHPYFWHFPWAKWVKCPEWIYVSMGVSRVAPDGTPHPAFADDVLC